MLCRSSASSFSHTTHLLPASCDEHSSCDEHDHRAPEAVSAAAQSVAASALAGDALAAAHSGGVAAVWPNVAPASHPGCGTHPSSLTTSGRLAMPICLLQHEVLVISLSCLVSGCPLSSKSNLFTTAHRGAELLNYIQDNIAVCTHRTLCRTPNSELAADVPHHHARSTFAA